MSHRAHAVFLEGFSGRAKPSIERERKPDPVELARLAARDEALEEARHAQAVLVRDLETLHQQELAAARETWLAAEAKRVDDALAHIRSDVTQDLSALVADCLQPFLERSARDAALAAFAAQLGELLDKGDALRLTVTGAQDYLAAVQERLGDRASACDFVMSDQVGLEASLAGSVVALRLDAWLGAFECRES